MKTNFTIIEKHFKNLLILFGLFAFSFQLEAQRLEAPQFVKTEVIQNEGEYLKLKLKNLPDPSIYGDANGKVDIQINFIVGECQNGDLHIITDKIGETSYTFITDYKLSQKDNNQKISISVSYIKSKNKILIPAQRNCIPIKVEQ